MTAEELTTELNEIRRKLAAAAGGAVSLEIGRLHPEAEIWVAVARAVGDGRKWRWVADTPLAAARGLLGQVAQAKLDLKTQEELAEGMKPKEEG